MPETPKPGTRFIKWFVVLIIVQTVIVVGVVAGVMPLLK